MIKKHTTSVPLLTNYATLFELTDEIENIWIICHGYGQLAEEFIEPFMTLDSHRNFVISLQGLSRFYLPGRQTVGASWMTKIDRELEMQNQIDYARVVLQEVLGEWRINNFKINVLGFSQGVSAMSRIIAGLKIQFNQFILWAGSFPPELTSSDFEYLNHKPQIFGVVGEQDRIVPMDVVRAELKLAKQAIGVGTELVTYQGVHEVKSEAIDSLILKF